MASLRPLVVGASLLCLLHILSDSLWVATRKLAEEPTDWYPWLLDNEEPSTKYILRYTPFFESEEWFTTSFADCPVSDCVITSDRQALPSMGDFDAVLFHVRDQRPSTTLPWRQPHQRFVFFNMESPEMMNEDGAMYKGYENFFNWTATYQWDSDIPWPYGWFNDRMDPEDEPSYPSRWHTYNHQAFAESLPLRPASFRDRAKRPKKVAWVVSNCGTKPGRLEYVEELRKYIDVDVMGKCGEIACDSEGADIRMDNCTRATMKDYKFYLSFENAFCQDYVTEKFFQRMSDLVVVVRGGNDFLRTAPPRSYINVDEFESPQELAEYLHQLDQHDDEYLSYFAWQDQYEISTKSNACRLCEMLHDETLGEQVYGDMDEWFGREQRCWQAPPLTTAKRRPRGSPTWKAQLEKYRNRFRETVRVDIESE